MDILGRIAALRQERNWTEYQLSVKSTLPQSTISSWYRKKMLPSLTSLEKICDAFDITLSQFFTSETEPMVLTMEQREMMHEWNRLEKTQKKMLLEFLKTI